MSGLATSCGSPALRAVAGWLRAKADSGTHRLRSSGSPRQSGARSASFRTMSPKRLLNSARILVRSLMPDGVRRAGSPMPVCLGAWDARARANWKAVNAQCNIRRNPLVKITTDNDRVPLPFFATQIAICNWCDRRHRGLWQSISCGAGPTVPIEMRPTRSRFQRRPADADNRRYSFDGVPWLHGLV